MTLLQLRTKLARYLQRSLADFISDGQDLLVEALESSRLLAERTYAWNAQRSTIEVEVPSSGYDLTSAEVSIKSIESAWGSYQGELYPIEVQSQKRLYQRQTRISRANNAGRYLSDADGTILAPRSTRVRLVSNGNLLTIYPTQTQTITVTLDIQTWMATYRGAANEYEDWMLEHGHDFLFWQSLIELNHIVKAFLPRQEGNLPPPQQNADRALLTLQEHDQRLISGAFYSR